MRSTKRQIDPEEIRRLLACGDARTRAMVRLYLGSGKRAGRQIDLPRVRAISPHGSRHAVLGTIDHPKRDRARRSNPSRK